MTALVTDNLPLLAAAPNGISQLRALILDLAIRGKLVEQSMGAEPADALIERISAARLAHESSRKTKTRASQQSGVADEGPFGLPAGWRWTNLATVAQINPRNAAPDDLDVSFVAMASIGAKFDSGHTQETRKWSEVKQGFTHFAEGDIGVAKITPCFENSKACVFTNLSNGIGAGTTELHIVRPFAETLGARYVLAYLKSPWFLLVGETRMTGTAGQKRLPKDFVESHPFPLPPLEEQNRIVAKVDELMALCDRLEAEQADADAAHATLVQALLASLTQARDAADFRASWQQLSEHFHTLFTTESSVDALKQCIVQLGVTGRLTSSGADCSDQAEAGSSDGADDAIGLWSTPVEWAWRRLLDVVEGGIQNGISPKAAAVPTHVRCLTLSATTRGTFNGSFFKHVDLLPEVLTKYWLKTGDLLIQRANSIDYVGVSAVYDDLDDRFIFPDLMMRTRVRGDMDVHFVHLCLSAAPSREYLRKHATGTQGNMPKVNQGTVGGIPVPVPSIAVQRAIVAKVKELMGVCDQLKNGLSSARQS
ncbi:MAG: hypothetical protein K2W93_02345, partial [Burkholderiaceae bacterium]|nr:hypothetical protein [Burkholderiaceae bacterium]